MKISPLIIFTAIIALSAYQAYAKPLKKIPVKKNPRKGGWTKKKIKEYNLATGAHLQHGVNYDPITLEDFKRKGSWATRHYKRKNTKSGLNMAPLKNEKGELMPFSTQAIVWGEIPPETRQDQKRIVELGEKLLATYHKYKDKGLKDSDLIPVNIRKKFKKSYRK